MTTKFVLSIGAVIAAVYAYKVATNHEILDCNVKTSITTMFYAAPTYPVSETHDVRVSIDLTKGNWRNVSTDGFVSLINTPAKLFRTDGNNLVLSEAENTTYSDGSGTLKTDGITIDRRTGIYSATTDVNTKVSTIRIHGEGHCSH